LLRDRGTSFDASTHRAIEAQIARAEGRYLDAVRLWDGVKNPDPVARPLRIGFLYFAAGDTRSAAQAFRTAERAARAKLVAGSNDTELSGQLALAQSMLGEHAGALATIDAARAAAPEVRDAINGPPLSFIRSVILVRAGRTAEGYAEADRLLRVPFAAPDVTEDPPPILLLLKDDPHYDTLINHPPRL
jgi:tetratricopeptide (TPR) repeat protein